MKIAKLVSLLAICCFLLSVALPITVIGAQPPKPTPTPIQPAVTPPPRKEPGCLESVATSLPTVGTFGSKVHSGTYALTDSPSGNYANNVDTAAQIAQAFDFSSATSPILSFWHRYEIESSYDDADVEVSTDGSIWTSVAHYDGYQSTYTQASIDLSAYNGNSTVYIRFRLRTDYSVTYDGWYIDDVSIDDGSTNLFSDDCESTAAWTLQAPWGLVERPTIAFVYDTGYTTVKDDLDELVNNGKISGYDTYTQHNIDELWTNLDQYATLLIDEDCMFRWTHPDPGSRQEPPVRDGGDRAGGLPRCPRRDPPTGRHHRGHPAPAGAQGLRAHGPL